jgi:lactoylglutathione lyase
VEEIMILEHIALYTNDIEGMREFYEMYFNAKANEKYHNPKTGLQTYFLTFDSGARLEIMTKPDVLDNNRTGLFVGLTHLAFRVENKDKVDELTQKVVNGGFILKSEPRTTGDGYYESCIFDPDGNEVEIIA